MDSLEKAFTAIAIIAIVLVVLSLFTGIFVKDQVAINCLEIQGYSNIKVEGKSWFMIPLRGGDRGDKARFKVRATNPSGKEVDVYVFAGWLFKGATIRTF